MSLIKQIGKIEHRNSYKFNMSWDDNREDKDKDNVLYNMFLEMKKMLDDSDVVEFDIIINSKTFKINKRHHYYYPELEKTIRPRFIKEIPGDSKCEAVPSSN